MFFSNISVTYSVHQATICTAGFLSRLLQWGSWRTFVFLAIGECQTVGTIGSRRSSRSHQPDLFQTYSVVRREKSMRLQLLWRCNSVSITVGGVHGGSPGWSCLGVEARDALRLQGAVEGMWASRRPGTRLRLKGGVPRACVSTSSYVVSF
jgi:hypothetical protein